MTDVREKTKPRQTLRQATHCDDKFVLFSLRSRKFTRVFGRDGTQKTLSLVGGMGRGSGGTFFGTKVKSLFKELLQLYE